MSLASSQNVVSSSASTAPSTIAPQDVVESIGQRHSSWMSVSSPDDLIKDLLVDYRADQLPAIELDDPYALCDVELLLLLPEEDTATQIFSSAAFDRVRGDATPLVGTPPMPWGEGENESEGGNTSTPVSSGELTQLLLSAGGGSAFEYKLESRDEVSETADALTPLAADLASFSPWPQPSADYTASETSGAVNRAANATPYHSLQTSPSESETEAQSTYRSRATTPTTQLPDRARIASLRRRPTTRRRLF